MKNLIMFILFCGAAYLLYDKLTYKPDDRLPAEVVRTVEVEVERVVKKIDREGFEHAVMEEVENVTRSYDSLRDSARREMDSVIKLLDIKQTQLNSYISYSASLKDSLLKSSRLSDSSFVYSDSNTKLEFVYDGVRTPYFNFRYDADVNYATYSKRDGLLGKRRSYVDFWISDDRVTINGVKRLSIEHPGRPVKFDLNASALYTDRLHTGFDAGLNLGRLRLGAGYLYDTSVKEWHPVFTAKYNLLDL